MAPPEQNACPLGAPLTGAKVSLPIKHREALAKLLKANSVDRDHGLPSTTSVDTVDLLETL